MPIRWDKFTVKAQEAVQRATELASEHGNPELAPLHLVASLVEDKEGIVPPVLEKIGIGPQAVLSEIYQEIEKQGYKGSESTVRGYIGQRRRERRKPKVYLPLEFGPGADAQVG